MAVLTTPLGRRPIRGGSDVDRISSLQLMAVAGDAQSQSPTRLF